MRRNYDLKKLKWKPNPYLAKLKASVTIRLDQDVVEYFKKLSNEEAIPYQTLINRFLKYCMIKNLKPKLNWG